MIDPPRTLVHLLGAADLGLVRGGIREALGSLSDEPPETQDDILSGRRSTSTETEHRTDLLPHHAAYRPLASGLYELASSGLERLDTLVLVATKQHQPHPDDTAALAELLAERVRATRGQLFDVITVSQASICIAASPTLDDVRTAVRAMLRGTVHSGPVGVTVGGGSTGALTGTLLGVLEAGLPPYIVEANRQDADASGPHLHALAVDHDTRAWAAASGNIPTVRAISDPARSGLADALFAVHQLDWARLERTPLARSTPWNTLVTDRAPADPEGWAERRDAIEAAIFWRLVRGDRGALHLLRPWIETEYGRRRAVSLRNGADPAAAPLQARDWMQRGPQELTSAPEPIRTFLEDTDVRWCWRKGATADHGGQPDPHLTSTRRRWLKLANPSNAFLTAHRELGPEPSIPGADVLVVQMVGRRDVQDGSTPMLDAVVEHFAPEGLRLRLLATEETATSAEQLLAKARARDTDARVIALHDGFSFAQVRRDVTDGLQTDPAWPRTHRAVLVTGPGTKAMNLGAMSGLLTTAFNHARPVEIAAVLRQTDGSSRVSVSPQRISSRLAQDGAVRDACLPLLEHLDLSSLESLLSHGSSRWDQLTHQVRAYRRLLLADKVTPDDAGMFGIDLTREEPAPVQLWRARTHCLRRLVGIDTWRAVYLIAVVAEQTKQMWRGATRPAGDALWKLRNDGPYGHASWAKPPTRREAERHIDELLAELPTGVDDRALTQVHTRLEHEAQRLCLVGSDQPQAVNAPPDR